MWQKQSTAGVEPLQADFQVWFAGRRLFDGRVLAEGSCVSKISIFYPYPFTVHRMCATSGRGACCDRSGPGAVASDDCAAFRCEVVEVWVLCMCFQLLIVVARVPRLHAMYSAILLYIVVPGAQAFAKTLKEGFHAWQKYGLRHRPIVQIHAGLISRTRSCVAALRVGLEIICSAPDTSYSLDSLKGVM